MTKQTKVVIETETVGQSFGTQAVIRSARTGRVLARTDIVRPHGNGSAALGDARALAATRGYVEIDATDLAEAQQ